TSSARLSWHSAARVAARGSPTKPGQPGPRARAGRPPPAAPLQRARAARPPAGAGPVAPLARAAAWARAAPPPAGARRPAAKRARGSGDTRAGGRPAPVGRLPRAVRPDTQPEVRRRREARGEAERRVPEAVRA